MEAVMEINCSSYSDNMIEVLKIFKQIGWDIYNPQGEVEYLPVGDDDMYNWQCEKISESKLYDIVSEKMAVRYPWRSLRLYGTVFVTYKPELVTGTFLPYRKVLRQTDMESVKCRRRFFIRAAGPDWG